MTVNETEARRFWAKVDVGAPDSCWEWTAARSHRYGVFSRGGRGGGMHHAHRVSWEIANGEIPPGMVVRHICDNPPCVNPSHLQIGTHEDNMRDMAQRERGWHTRLTAVDVSAIRSLVSSGVRHADIAIRFGTSKSNISMIATRKTWRHVA